MSTTGKTWMRYRLGVALLVGTVLLAISACGRPTMSRNSELDLQEELFRMALGKADTTSVCFLACREGEGDTSIAMQDPPQEIFTGLAELELELLPLSAALPHPDASLAQLGVRVGPGGKPSRTYIAWIRKRLTAQRVVAGFGSGGGGLSGSGVEVLMEHKSGRWKVVKELSTSVS
jgi:hypothetical protein